MKKIAAIDLDDTLYDVQKIIIEFCSSINYTMPDTWKYNFVEFDEEVRKKLFEMFIDPNFMGYLELINKEDIKNIELLNVNYEILFVTSRKHSLYKCTNEMVKRDFPNIGRVVCIDGNKLEYFESLKPSIIIDDYPENFKTFLNTETKIYFIRNKYTCHNHYFKAKASNLFEIEKISDITFSEDL